MPISIKEKWFKEKELTNAIADIYIALEKLKPLTTPNNYRTLEEEIERILTDFIDDIRAETKAEEEAEEQTSQEQETE